MYKYKLSDFKVGQKVYVELHSNAKRYSNIAYEEWDVISIGRKYVTATKSENGHEYKFGEHNLSYGGLKQKTDYSVDYTLYPNKEILLNKIKSEVLFSKLMLGFKYYNKNNYSLEQLKSICEILEIKED